MFTWKTAKNLFEDQNTKPIPSKQGTLKANKLEPGDLIFSDQFESRLPGRVFGQKGSYLSSQNIEVVPYFVIQPVDSFLQKVNLP